jgi:RNA recognition motif-containing protein
MNIYVGNLSYGMTDDELRQAFSAHGEVSSAKILMDRETGRSRGFGFVEMQTNDIEALIKATDGHEVDGRNLRVNQAEDKPSGGRGPGGSNGGSRGGFGGRRERY